MVHCPEVWIWPLIGGDNGYNNTMFFFKSSVVLLFFSSLFTHCDWGEKKKVKAQCFASVLFQWDVHLLFCLKSPCFVLPCSCQLLLNSSIRNSAAAKSLVGSCNATGNYKLFGESF